MSKRPSKAASRVTAANWPATSNPIPHGANVVLGFHGLMCFCFRRSHSDKNCEVGIHNNSDAHNLSITVYKVAPSFDPPYDMDMCITPQTQPYAGPYRKAQTGSLKGNIVRFDVNEPRVSGVQFFQSGPGPRSHPDNFRHILDLEHDFYPGFTLPKKPHHMGPRLRINHGLFYTLCKSETQFERVEVASPPGGPSVHIGSVARMVGTNIYLENDGDVTLKMSGAPDKTLKAAEGKFFVLIDNGCKACPSNEFPLYYDTFDPPRGDPRVFDLNKTSTGTGSLAPGSPCEIFLPQVNSLLKELGTILSTDDAPCGAAGFGISGSLG